MEGSFKILGSSCIYNGVVEVPTPSVDFVVNAKREVPKFGRLFNRYPTHF